MKWNHRLQQFLPDTRRSFGGRFRSHISNHVSRRVHEGSIIIGSLAVSGAGAVLWLLLRTTSATWPSLNPAPRTEQSPTYLAGVHVPVVQTSSLAAHYAYQDMVIQQTAMWHPPNTTFPRFPGQDSMCSKFFFYFAQARKDGVYFGDRILVPICIWWTIYEVDQAGNQAAKEYIEALDRKYTYFMVEGHDKSLDAMSVSLPDEIDLLIFSGGGTFRGARNIPIPLLLDRILEPTGLEKNITLSSTNLNHVTNRVRRPLILEIRSWANNSDMLPLQIIETAQLESNEFAQILENSIMTLAPRGNGCSSFRMYQALQMCAVPIYIWDEDKALPFEEIVNWNHIAIVLSASKLLKLRGMIDSFDIPRAQRLLRKYRSMWGHDFLHQYITERLQKEPTMLPVPIASYDDQDTVYDEEPLDPIIPVT